MDINQYPLSGALFGYLLGSVSCAILVCRALGAPDPRTQGSGNPGATNVLRVAGKKAAALTLLGDALKGLLPILLMGIFTQDTLALACTGVAAFLGHLYPVFFRFQGGKGVATIIGVLLGLAWPLGAAFIAIWLIMVKGFKTSSLSALTAAALTPFITWYLNYPREYLIAVSFMVLLLIYRHRSNIRNLLTGAEDKLTTR